MHQQLHHRKGGAGNTYLLNVVIRNQADGLVVIVGRGLFLGLPPVIIAALFQNVENIPLGNLQLPIGLRGVVVDGLVDAEEPHGSCWSPAGCRVAVLRCRRPHRRSRDVSEVSRGEGAPQSRARAGRGRVESGVEIGLRRWRSGMARATAMSSLRLDECVGFEATTRTVWESESKRAAIGVSLGGLAVRPRQKSGGGERGQAGAGRDYV